MPAVLGPHQLCEQPAVGRELTEAAFELRRPNPEVTSRQIGFWRPGGPAAQHIVRHRAVDRLATRIHPERPEWEVDVVAPDRPGQHSGKAKTGQHEPHGTPGTWRVRHSTFNHHRLHAEAMGTAPRSETTSAERSTTEHQLYLMRTVTLLRSKGRSATPVGAGN